MLGRECERRGRVRVEMLARDEFAYSRLLDTHWETCRLTEWLVDGRWCIGSASGWGTVWGCS